MNNPFKFLPYEIEKIIISYKDDLEKEELRLREELNELELRKKITKDLLDNIVFYDDYYKNTDEFISHSINEYRYYNIVYRNILREINEIHKKLIDLNNNE